MRNFEFQAKKIDVFSRWKFNNFYFQEQKSHRKPEYNFLHILIFRIAWKIYNISNQHQSLGLGFLEFSSCSTSGERMKCFFLAEIKVLVAGIGVTTWLELKENLSTTEGKVRWFRIQIVRRLKTQYCVQTFCSTKPFTIDLVLFCYRRLLPPELSHAWY